MTKSLTEKWKDGELGFGYYYIDFGIGGVPMLFNGIEFYCERGICATNRQHKRHSSTVVGVTMNFLKAIKG